MKVLMIGGTGIISEGVAKHAATQGFEVYLLNRGTRGTKIPEGCHFIHADINDPVRMEEVMTGHYFDVVIDWICFHVDQIERDIQLFRGKVGQYIFISSASAYHKPVNHYVIKESTPLYNPHWQYSRDKIACEDRLNKAYQEEGFPMTIIRPSHTYGDQLLPWVFDSNHQWSLIDRIQRGQSIVVPGDGTSLWTVTHNSDFAKGLVGLLGHPQAIGESFHITSDEALTWNMILQTIGDALGVTPKMYHIATDFIVGCEPDWEGGLVGDKMHSVVFDNSKVKALVPTFICGTPFYKGVRQTIAYMKAHPEYQTVDADWNKMCDRLIECHEKGINAYCGGD